MPGKEIPADPLSRLTNLPSAVGSELNSSVDFEPRYPLPHPLDKINKVLFLESADKESTLSWNKDHGGAGHICGTSLYIASSLNKAYIYQIMDVVRSVPYQLHLKVRHI